jgi:hypothetical protein
MRAIATITGFIVLLAPVGCATAQALPDCNADATRYQVLITIAGKVVHSPNGKFDEAAFVSAGGSIEKRKGEIYLTMSGQSVRFTLSEVRAEKFDEKLQRYECAARFSATLPNGLQTQDIRYISQLADGGRTHLVIIQDR